MTDSTNSAATIPKLIEPIETDESENLSPIKPLPSKPSWVEKRAKEWGGVRLLERVSMINKLKRQSRMVRRLTRKQQDGTIGEKTEEPEDSEDEDVDTHIGDTNATNHYYPQPAQTTQTPTSPSTLSKALLTGVAATGLGLPIGGALALPSILDTLKGTPAQVEPTAPAPAPVIDNDTLFELRGREK